MSRLTSVLTMFLAFLAGNAIGLPAELATHSAKVNATNRVALDQVRGSIETNEANNGTVPATVSVRSVRCSPLKTPTACTPLVRVSAHALTAAISRHARIATLALCFCFLSIPHISFSDCWMCLLRCFGKAKEKGRTLCCYRSKMSRKQPQAASYPL